MTGDRRLSDRRSLSRSRPRARSRRHVLAGLGLVTASSVALAGCLEDDDGEVTDPGPVALTDGATCDVCGMVIDDHYGPAGQLFYDGDGPPDRDGPARFDSITELVVYHEEQRARDRDLLAAFVTDYSRVDDELTERDGTTYISTHADEAAFSDATDAVYAVGSEVEGAMGSEYLPFGDREDAVAFVDDHGGEIYEWDDLLGGA